VGEREKREVVRQKGGKIVQRRKGKGGKERKKRSFSFLDYPGGVAKGGGKEKRKREKNGEGSES